MAIVVKQDFRSEALAFDSKKEKYTGATQQYTVTGASSEKLAVEAVNEIAPKTYNGCKRISSAVTERFSSDGWRVEVKYERLVKTLNDSTDLEPEREVSFDVSGVSQKITRSFHTIKNSAAASCDGMIGWDGSSVQGCDIIVPEQKFQEIQYFKDSKVTTNLKKKWTFSVGGVNADTFRGYAAGEVLLLGVSGRRSGTGKDDLWQVTFSFGVRENEVIQFGGESLPKCGWDFVWYSWSKRKDANRISPQVKAVYIEKVYKRVVFGELGIGN